ncbi:MAG: VKORC1/thioredoxin domain protein [Candidatus Jorgensenbacteria bacterium GW2011_GWA1_48_11]|uniref:VKORC1/thioredoxin domain protein n=1 Tax=Candidatus Jorgensenbacteria bacterium GW2011_GWA1_48_11 TaxID=1618660 RepID=A0A0G1UCB3_9BACT|nr:MAG: VKORC1/thioredoxin domain protein [Candidatus Jorgensenbacteria bacterium GW2011_GWA1_48_11]KKW12277.1 MAG: VKORC1/thioredoxin domain protein [Candidatus Jorgensenbacteria bacterium GW2011_GWB1_49_9]
MNKDKKAVVTLLVLAVVVLAVYLFYRRGPVFGQYDDFAKCLASKPVTMYGAYWCAHCESQKNAFGGSFKYVPYVECTRDVQECLVQKINGYPTWIFPDGRRLEGEMSLNDLSAQSGCVLN